MFLKSVELQGFKSFADKIYLDFHLGITAIVGPNGSGKSNISDAIRWVMGEQSAKSLRGAKMEDIIFSGTQERKALGFAEVSLTLDNSDGSFDLDFPEVTVTRRVYRSGEGEYFINKTSCRLKDIHELFMDTGIGREGYSIIGQGKVDEILSNKSEDRRQIFEEAAGITKYKYRKNEAEKKLSQTNENLLRVKDILNELEGQLAPLQQQSEKAKKFLVLRDELRVLEVNAAVVSIDTWRADLAELEKNLAELTGQIADIQTQTEAADQAVKQMYEQIEQYDQEIEQQRLAEHDTEAKINEFHNEINLLTANIGHTEENIQRIKAEIEKEKKSIGAMDADLKEQERQLLEYEEKKAVFDNTLEKLNAQMKLFAEETGAKNEELESLKSEVIEQTTQMNDARGKIANLNVLLENFRTRQQNIQEELAQKNVDFQRLEQNTAILEKDLKTRETELEQETAALSQATAERQEGETTLRREQSCLNQWSMELANKRSKKKLMEDMQREFEGYTKSVKSLMTAYQAGKMGKIEIHGPLAQLIHTEARYVTAIDIALGAANQNIVTQTEQDAKQAIAYLKQNRLGRATFLPVSTVKGRTGNQKEVSGMKGYIATAAELVECEPQYREIVSNLLGTTVVAETIDDAIAMAKQSGHRLKIVTLEGEVLQPGGAMTGGSTGKSGGLLSRANEIAALEKEIEQLSQNCVKKEKETEALRLRIEELSKQESARQEEIHQKKETVIKMTAEYRHLEEFCKSVTDGKAQLEQELQDVQAQITNIIRDNQANQETVTCAEQRVKQLEREIAQKQDEFSESGRKSEALNQELMSCNIDRNALLKDIEVVHHVMQNINQEKSEFFEDIQSKQEEAETLKNKILDLKDDIAFKQKQMEEFTQKTGDFRSRAAELAQQKRETEDKIKRSQEETKNTREQLFSLGQQQAKVEGRQNRLETDLENITNRLWEEYELTYTEAVKLKETTPPTEEHGGKRIAQLKDEIKRLGNINIDAIEEYKNVRERFDFLMAQTRDLDQAKHELEQLIAEMLDIMKKQFSEQFALINKNFNEVFSELFGGGKANLILEDPNSILESGIEIEAQPPGKKLQRLSLLSGGERAFTAIALLFAILKVRPTPFCILDEIEAALDDVNVYRYADYLKRFSQKTQFIVVTHRRGTMEAANMLYGVTMQERGVSKLLSLNIDEVAN